MNIIIKLLLVIPALMVSAHAQDQLNSPSGNKSQHTERERRTKLAKDEWASVVEKRRRVNSNEFYVLTFAASHRPNEPQLSRLLNGMPLQVSAVFFQGEDVDGVYAFDVDAKNFLPDELRRISKERPKASEARVRQLDLMKKQGAIDAPSNNRKADDLYCAIEVRGNPSDVEEFRQANVALIETVEISNPRMRRMPYCENK
jgi:hypothetical protein